MNRLYLPPIVFATVACVLFLVAMTLPATLFVSESVAIDRGSDGALRVNVYTPADARSGPLPAIAIFQPMNNPPETYLPLVAAFVEQHFVVLNVEWRGRAPNENRQTSWGRVQERLASDASAVIAYLESRRDVDAARIAVLGHSIGANLAWNVALAQPEIAACVVVGLDMAGAAPRNTLWAAGMYDELRSPAAVLAAMGESGVDTGLGWEADAMVHTGNFADGTARGIFISSTSDHFTEMMDHRIHQASIEWLCRSLNVAMQPRRTRDTARTVVFAVAGLFASLAFILLCTTAIAKRPWLARVLAAAILAYTVGLLVLSPSEPAIWASLMLPLLVSVLAGGYAAVRGRPNWAGVARIAAIVCVSVWATLVVNAIPAYTAHPHALLQAPLFAALHAAHWVHIYLVCYARQFLFWLYAPDNVHPRLFVYAILIVELAIPGGVFRLIARFKAARSARIAAAPVSHKSALQIAILAVLAIGLLGVLGLRASQGFLTAETITAALVFVGRYGVAPVVVFTLLWRLLRRRRHAGPFS